MQAKRSVPLTPAQLRQDQQQQKMLDSCFTKIKRHGDRAGVHTAIGANLYFPDNPFLYVGSRFKLGEKDFSFEYLVERIDAKGLAVSYNGGGMGYPKNTTGTFLLKWKP